MPCNLPHCICDCVLSNQEASHPEGQLGLQDERGLLSTRQPAMSHRDRLCKSRKKGEPNHSLHSPRPSSPRIHKSSAGIAGFLINNDETKNSGSLRNRKPPST